MKKDIFEGSLKLLEETVDIAKDYIEKIVIVGGWGPYIRHVDQHPGTRDVDFLFPQESTKEEIEQVLYRFLENGYFISAKHDFQLCRAFEIGKYTYIYNLDLLHPSEGKINKIDFINVMDLDVTDGIRVKKIQTINIQYGQEIYSAELFENIEFRGRRFNVLDASGVVLSKMNSCHNKKRTRDIYDIFLSLREANARDKLIQLSQGNGIVKENIEDYNSKLDKEWDYYAESLCQYGIVDVRIDELQIK